MYGLAVIASVSNIERLSNIDEIYHVKMLSSQTP